MLAETCTDGFLVVHDGVVVTERYFDGMAPSDTHLLMSVSKSLNSTLCGVLVGEGAARTGDLVSDHIAELRGTAWEGCTVQHLLDMRVGVRWDFDLDEHTILDVSDYRGPRAHGHPRRYRLVDPHDPGRAASTAGRSPTTRSPTTCSAGCSSVPEACPTRRCSPTASGRALGAEHDAEIIVDGSDFSIVEGGICATLRDLARFGLMCLQGGAIGGRRIVPADWIDAPVQSATRG